MRFCIGLVVGLCMGTVTVTAGAITAEERERTYAQLTLFAKVLNLVQNGYVEDLPPERLVDGAIRGLVAQLDGHSRYLSKEEVEALRPRPPPAHVGLRFGAVRDRGRLVEDVLPEGSAARAGLRVGDLVLALEERPLAELELSDIHRRLEGEDGQILSLSLPGSQGPRELRLPRQRLRPFHVRSERHGPFGRLVIERFTVDTPLDVRRNLERLGALDGLVIDLRGNPGGLVASAARVADLWMKEGTIVSTEARGRVLEKLVAHPRGTEPDYPLVVLVDEQTASAAEILTAALEASRRARVVGARTFGKGTVQTIAELEDGSALKLTVARHYSPSHQSIQGRGISPDVVVRGGRGRRDLGMETALQVLSGR
ncbi:MAG: S41 family peptidase [Myxococcota bacterium]